MRGTGRRVTYIHMALVKCIWWRTQGRSLPGTCIVAISLRKAPHPEVSHRPAEVPCQKQAQVPMVIGAQRPVEEPQIGYTEQQVEDGGKKKSSVAMDQYEKSVPSHGDEYLHNFISVMRKHPGQLLRYDRLSGSGPLLMG